MSVMPKFISLAQTSLLNPRLNYPTAYLISPLSNRQFKFCMSRMKLLILFPMLRILTAFSISVHGNSFLQLIQVENYEIILVPVFLSYHTKIHFTLSSECIHNLTTFHHYYISNATVVGQAIIIPYMDDYNNLLTGFHVCPFKSTQDRCPDEFF